jgi:hypothetical protein
MGFTLAAYTIFSFVCPQDRMWLSSSRQENCSESEGVWYVFQLSMSCPEISNYPVCLVAQSDEPACDPDRTSGLDPEDEELMDQCLAVLDATYILNPSLNETRAQFFDDVGAASAACLASPCTLDVDQLERGVPYNRYKEALRLASTYDSRACMDA